MRRRCYNKNEKSYSRYGGRGIKVMWDSFNDFYTDMSPTFKKGLSIERIDNDGNYSKKNCKWITMAEQARNKRSVRIINYKGLSLTMREWDKKLGFQSGTVRSRLLVHKWPIEKALTTPKWNSKKFLLTIIQE